MEYLIKNIVLKELERQKQMKRTYERRRSKVQSFETDRLELNIKNGQTYYYRPDFTLLHPFLHRIYLWEHLGMWYHESEKRNYRRSFLHKTEEYEKIGFYLGNNLLTSYELANGGINMNRFQDTCDSILEQTGEEPVYVDAKKFLQDQRKHMRRSNNA